MFRLFIITFITMFIVISSLESPVKACSESDKDLIQVIGEETYFSMCPHGDAVIVSKEEKKFLGKNIGIAVDCVNWDNKHQQWLTKTFDLTTGLWGDTVAYADKDYEVYSMDGHLIHNAKGDVIAEKVFLSQKELDDLGIN